jgi:hypothetical protein
VIAFDTEPAVLSPAHTGGVRLRQLDIVGAVPEMTTCLWDDSPTPMYWRPTTQRTVDGVPISRFEVAWDDATVRRVLGLGYASYDHPVVALASLHAGRHACPKANEKDWTTVNVRFAPTGTLSPATDTEVRTIASADIQYTSDVVNLRWDGFGASWHFEDGGHDDDLKEVAKRFYRHFRDVYHVLAVSTAEMDVAGGGGYHQNVYTEICGVGLEQIEGFSCEQGSPKTPKDDRDQYSDGRRLRVLEGVEYYPQHYGLEDWGVSHEYAHQYAHYFDWKYLANIEPAPASWHPESHAPLWAEHETLVGAVLPGERLVGSGPQIALPPRPFRFAPLTRYAMGLLPEAAVLPTEVFNDQGQFEYDKPPLPGTPVKGATVEVPIADIANPNAYGPRTGPVLPKVVRRATVIVSRGRLLSRAEMNYWTFFVRRLSETGKRINYDGFGSFAAATEGASRFDTTIVPLRGTPLPHPDPDAGDPPFGRDGWSGVLLDQALPTEVELRTNGTADLKIAGAITDPTLSGFTIWVAFDRACTKPMGCQEVDGNGNPDVDTFPLHTRSWVELPAAGTARFQGTVTFADNEPRRGRGQYRVWFYAQDGQQYRWLGPGWSTLRVR